MRRLPSESVSRPTKRRSPRLATSSWIIAIAFSLFLQSCGTSNDIDSESNRKAMEQDILNELTGGDCVDAITKSTLLFNSKYSDNTIRMLFASSEACVTGVRFYGMLNAIPNNDFGSVGAIFKSLVKMFPSRTASDSSFQSAMYAQDALQSILNPGAVIAPADLTFGSSFNPGSARYFDRTDDSNLFLMFVAMGELGSGLNRYGFAASDDPAATGYVPTQTLPWETLAAVKADTTGSACGIASSYYNLVDAIVASIGLLPSKVSGKIGNVVSILTTALDTVAQAQCSTALPLGDGFSASQCAAGIARLRYRGACAEQDPAASAAAGIIHAINLGWI